jgi:hypothetical protein
MYRSIGVGLCVLFAAAAALADDARRAMDAAAPRVFLVPETQTVHVGDLFTVDLYWDFTGDAALTGGTDVAWDPAGFVGPEVAIADNADFDPAFTRCDDDGDDCVSAGHIDGLAVGNFNGLAGDGPLHVATITLRAREQGTFTIDLAQDDNSAGPFISAQRLEGYPDLEFSGASVDITVGPPGPRIFVRPAWIVFPDTAITETASVTATISNIGPLPLALGAIGAPAAPFAVALDGCSGQTLTSDAECELTVTFAPTALGHAEGTISVPSDDPRRPVVQIELDGVGLPVPAAEIAAARFMGIPARIGHVGRTDLVVRNVGTASLAIGPVGAADPIEAPFALASDACSNQALAPGTECAISVTFSPSEIGVATAGFDIPSSDADEPVTSVFVRGNAYPRVTLRASGMGADVGRCTNLRTGRVITVPLGGVAVLPCEAVGLEVEGSDPLAVSLRGAAHSATALTGQAVGMRVANLTCRNETTGQSIVITPVAPENMWDCVESGLTVTAGDVVTMTAAGSAY